MSPSLIWYAVVNAVPGEQPPDEWADVAGVFVAVAATAPDETGFRLRLDRILGDMGLTVVDLDKVKTWAATELTGEPRNEAMELAATAAASGDVEWGTIHTYEAGDTA